MAGDNELSKGAADKGKGKAVDEKQPEVVKKDENGKPIVNGKKDEDKIIDGLFSRRCSFANVCLICYRPRRAQRRGSTTQE